MNNNWWGISSYFRTLSTQKPFLIHLLYFPTQQVVENALSCASFQLNFPRTQENLTSLRENYLERAAASDVCLVRDYWFFLVKMYFSHDWQMNFPTSAPSALKMY